jgi:hypothetical protein
LTVLVTYESPLGTTRRMLWSPIHSLENPQLTADRLAAELIASTSADDLQADDHVVTVEARRRYQPFRFGLGAGLLILPANGDAPIGLSAALHLAYEGARWGAVAEGTLGTNLAGGNNPTLLAHVSLGVRHYILAGNTSPFVGLGFSYGSIRENAGEDAIRDFSPFCVDGCGFTEPGHVSGSGFGSYAELGLVFSRLRRAPLAVVLRADIPFFELTRDLPDYVGFSISSVGVMSTYEVPVTLSLVESF